MKYSISVLAFVLTLLVIQKVYVESYSFKCPSQGSWKVQAKLMCYSTLKYFCLYNNLRERYVEGCEGPDWDRKGSKRIFSVSFTRGECIQKRYQPFRFQTNESMSDCIYSKSLCNEEGQIAYTDGSSKNDRTCRCDYIRNYSFIKTPKHVCYCIPTEEDCSCYIKSCQLNFTLSTDYNCTPNGYKEKPKCIETIRDSTTIYEEIEVNTEKNNIYSEHRWNETLAAVMLVLICFICMLVIGAFSKNRYQIIITRLNVLRKWSSKKLQSSEIYIGADQTDTAETDIRRTESANTLDEIYYESCEAELTVDEIYYLRMINLIFRVACPVVRMLLNKEIKPTHLQKSLDKYKAKMEKQYRKREEIINNHQWDVLYERNKGKTVKSEDFDIRLMVFILHTIVKIQVGDLYPVQADTCKSAMLSRIQYIRNETTQSVKGELSAEQFKRYWDDIGQAVLTLVPNIEDITDDTEKAQLIDRLNALNPIDIDHNKLRLFIAMSEIYPARILQKIISEYCMLKSIRMEDILRKEKHQLYHKRVKTESCCLCKAEFSTFIKVIPEKLWENLYEVKQDSDCHHCQSHLKQCCENFFPKKVDMCDLSVTVAIILNIPDILKYIISRLYTNEFDKFLLNNMHTIYHYMEKNKCCECVNDPPEKNLIYKTEWNTLFKKQCDKSCQNCVKDCCCQYTVIKGIKSYHMDETLLSKIFHIAGPISVLKKIEQASFLYFLNWTVDERPLRDALLDLLSIIKDTPFSSEMLKVLEETITEKVDVQQWIFTHANHEKVSPDPQLQILFPDKDGFSTKSVRIPKDVTLPNRTRYFEDYTDEENNFLKIFHILTKIVYSVIKNEFNTLCTDDVLDAIRMDIYGQQIRECHKDTHKDKHQRQRIYLTQKQREQLFTPTKKESKDWDFKLMIYILRRITEEEGKKDYIDQLDVIDNIRREIVQHSSGVLNDTRFQEILTCIEKALLHFGKELYEDKITNLHHIRNTIEFI